MYTCLVKDCNQNADPINGKIIMGDNEVIFYLCEDHFKEFEEGYKKTFGKPLARR